MTTLWVDSGSAYGSAADVATVVYPAAPVTYGTPQGVSAASGRFATGAIVNDNNRGDVPITLPVGMTAGVMGFVYRHTAIGSGVSVWKASEGATLHLYLETNASNIVVLKRGGGTVLATATTPIVTGVDIVFQVKFNIHDSTGSCEVWINDNKEIDVSGVDTRNAGTTGAIDTFAFCSSINAFSFAHYSEIYINNTLGSAPNNTVWGGYRIQPRRPATAGNYSQFTPSASTNVSNVDDTPGHDADSTYNSSLTPGQRDSFQLGAISPTSGAVLAVMSRLVARKDDAGVRTMAPFVRQSGTDYDGTTSPPLLISYQHHCQVLALNPATGVAFTVDEMRATTPEFGYKVVA